MTKGPFIATQLHSTRRRVELRRYRHPHRRNSTVADDRQCNWPSWTAYSQSAWSRSVKLSCVGVTIETSPTQLNSTSSRVELCRYKRALTCRLRWTDHINEKHRPWSCNRPAVRFSSSAELMMGPQQIWTLKAAGSLDALHRRTGHDWSTDIVLPQVLLLDHTNGSVLHTIWYASI